MQVNITTELFSFSCGQANVHVQPDSQLSARHFHASERCHEFISVDIEAPDGNTESKVSIFLEPHDALRLVETISAAIRRVAEDGAQQEIT